MSEPIADDRIWECSGVIVVSGTRCTRRIIELEKRLADYNYLCPNCRICHLSEYHLIPLEPQRKLPL